MARTRQGQGQTLSGSPASQFTNFAQKPIQSIRAPTTADTGYEIGQTWVDTSTAIIYGLGSVSAGNATWNIMSPGASDVDTLTGDTGGALPPTGGNINILGTNGVTVAGAGSTLTVQSSTSGFPITTFVVGPSGEAGYQTIQSALSAANAAGGGIVFVQPDTYTENLTLFDNTQIVGAVGLGDLGALIIIGEHTPPASGSFVIRNCKLQSATNIFDSAVAGTSSVFIIDVAIDVTNGYVFNLPNWTGAGGFGAFDIGEIGSTDCGWVNNTGGATVFMTNITMGAGSGNIMITSGFVELYNCVVQCPVDFQMGTNGIAAGGTVFQNTVTFSDNSTLDIYNSAFTVGTNQAITYDTSANSTLGQVSIDSTNNPAVGGTGSGILTFSDVGFVQNSVVTGTFTQSFSQAITGGVEIREAGQTLSVEGGAVTDFIGTAMLAAGTVTIANTNIVATDRIFLSYTGALAAPGFLTSSIIASTSFTITSSDGTDASTVNYFIVRQL